MSEATQAPKKKKKKGGDDEGGGDTFIVGFTALMVILLAFFVFLNSMAVQDNRRERNALASLMGTFGMLPGGRGVEQTGHPVHNRLKLSDEESPPLTKTMSAIRNRLKLDALPDGVEVSGEGNRYTITFADSVLFAGGGDVISPLVFPVLDRVGDTIRELGIPVRIEGHTDPIPPGRRSGYDDNWELAASRAIDVASYFEDACRVPRLLLQVASLAHHRPPRAEDDLTGLTPKERARLTTARSRRVELELITQNESVHLFDVPSAPTGEGR